VKDLLSVQRLTARGLNQSADVVKEQTSPPARFKLVAAEQGA
jgi:hypothetical protein